MYEVCRCVWECMSEYVHVCAWRKGCMHDCGGMCVFTCLRGCLHTSVIKGIHASCARGAKHKLFGTSGSRALQEIAGFRVLLRLKGLRITWYLISGTL